MRSLQPHSFLITTLTWLLLALSGMHSASAAQTSLVTEAIVNLPVADAWQLFIGEAGLKSLGYTSAKTELQLGGQWQAGGGAVALNSINAQIISFDPERMLSFKPAGDQSNNQWAVLYFTAMGKDMTQLRWLEFFPESDSAAVKSHQLQVRKLFDQLIRRYAPECEVCKLEKESVSTKSQ